jgi:hypothetical protein
MNKYNMNKKGLVFTLYIIIITLTVFIYLFMTISKSIDSLPSYSIGERQFEILQNYQRIDSEFIEMDKTFLSASKNAVLVLASNGGFSEAPLDYDDEFYGENGCGSYMGFPLWNSREKGVDECFPEIGIEFNHEFGKQLYKLMPSDYDSLTYTVSIRKVQSFSEIIGGSDRVIEISKGMRDSESSFKVSKILNPSLYEAGSYSEYSSEEDDSPIKVSLSYEEAQSFVPAYTATNYESCTALHYHVGSSGQYTYTTREDFRSFVSFKSPYVRFIANPQGNAVQADFGKKLLEVAKAWNQMEGGKAALALYSVSTGKHSKTSKHNVGLGADITGCYDKNGKYHDIKLHSATFTRCHDLIFSMWKDYGLFISHKECVMKEGHDCPSKASLIRSHSNHIHVQKG